MRLDIGPRVELGRRLPTSRAMTLDHRRCERRRLLGHLEGRDHTALKLEPCGCKGGEDAGHLHRHRLQDLVLDACPEAQRCRKDSRLLQVRPDIIHEAGDGHARP